MPRYKFHGFGQDRKINRIVRLEADDDKQALEIGRRIFSGDDYECWQDERRVMRPVMKDG